MKTADDARTERERKTEREKERRGRTSKSVTRERHIGFTCTAGRAGSN